nr:hypothetical protein HK105_006907 [Polyrhizophydium stewartii]
MQPSAAPIAAAAAADRKPAAELAKSSASPSAAKAPLPVLIARSVVFRMLVFRKILLLNDGRDKVLKCFQYTAKVLLWCYLTDPKRFPLAHDRASKIAAQFSITRKIVRLGHWLESYNDHLELAKEGLFTVDASLSPAERTARLLAPLSAWIGIVNDLSDDVVCIGKMGLIDKSWVKWATPISDRCWYMSIFIDLHANVTGTRKLLRAHAAATDPAERAKIADKLWTQRISFAKLLADFMFCTIDVFEMGDRVSDGWQAVSGLVAALLGTCKLYRKHK